MILSVPCLDPGRDPGFLVLFVRCQYWYRGVWGVESLRRARALLPMTMVQTCTDPHPPAPKDAPAFGRVPTDRLIRHIGSLILIGTPSALMKIDTSRGMVFMPRHLPWSW